jgi:hypothetical protein
MCAAGVCRSMQDIVPVAYMAASVVFLLGEGGACPAWPKSSSPTRVVCWLPGDMRSPYPVPPTMPRLILTWREFAPGNQQICMRARYKQPPGGSVTGIQGCPSAFMLKPLETPWVAMGGLGIDEEKYVDGRLVASMILLREPAAHNAAASYVGMLRVRV